MNGTSFKVNRKWINHRQCVLNCRLQTIVASPENFWSLIELRQLLKSHARRKSDSGHDQTKFLLSYQSIKLLSTKGRPGSWMRRKCWLAPKITNFVFVNWFIGCKKFNQNCAICLDYFKELLSLIIFMFCSRNKFKKLLLQKQLLEWLIWTFPVTWNSCSTILYQQF